MTSKKKIQISINKIGAYLTANASRRKQIIKDQKFPPDFKVIYYEDATNVSTDYIAENLDDVNYLMTQADALLTKPTANKQQEDKIKCCAEMVIAFHNLKPSIDLSPYDFSTTVKRNKVAINEVEISARPELLLKFEKKGKKYYGAIKLYFQKNEPLNSTSGNAVATLLHQYMEENYGSKRNISRKDCLVIDVYSGQIFITPSATARIKKNIEAACEEIGVLWPTIKK